MAPLTRAAALSVVSKGGELWKVTAPTGIIGY
jgi:hypothetical protein